MYDGCTNHQDKDGKFWCSTKTDDKHNHHGGGEGNFGYCPDACKKSKGDGMPRTASQQQPQINLSQGEDKQS